MPGDQVDVVAEVHQPRERDVPRADHQRDEVEAHPLHDRHGEEEHHRRAVRREELVVEVGAEEASSRGRASWSRISSARTPPSRKKTNAVTM